MDAHRFDTFTRLLARRLTRRAAAIAGGGLAMVAAGTAPLVTLAAKEPKANKKKCKAPKKLCRKKCVNVLNDPNNCGRCKQQCASNEICADGSCQIVLPPELENCNGPCRVFASSVRPTGNIGGLEGADQICTDLARAQSLPGTYRAWLSVGNESPSNRFNQNPDPYTLIDGTLVASNWDDLVDGALASDIFKDEKGAVVGTFVWTNTNADGTTYSLTRDCNGWTSGSGVVDSATFGNSFARDANWTAFSQQTTGQLCDDTFPIYCFQQTP